MQAPPHRACLKLQLLSDIVRVVVEETNFQTDFKTSGQPTSITSTKFFQYKISSLCLFLVAVSSVSNHCLIFAFFATATNSQQCLPHVVFHKVLLINLGA